MYMINIINVHDKCHGLCVHDKHAVYLINIMNYLSHLVQKIEIRTMSHLVEKIEIITL